MTLYTTGELFWMIFLLVAGIGVCIAGWAIYDKFCCTKYDALEGIGAIMGGIGALTAIVVTVVLCINVIGAAVQRQNEVVRYQGWLEESNSLQAAINSTQDMLNVDLYVRAVEFNADLAKIQTAQADPKYSPMFSGNVDWRTIPLVDLGQAPNGEPIKLA